MNILLCGFMGCGKSSVGKKVAHLSNYKFYDTDKYIEKKEGISISEIFNLKGEPYFREQETLAVKELCQKDHVIIASGGGLVLKEENVQIIKNSGCKIVYMDVPLRALHERLKRTEKRPLLQREDRTEFINTLHAQREPIYKKVADYVLPSGMPVVPLAKNLLKLIENWE